MSDDEEYLKGFRVGMHRAAEIAQAAAEAMGSPASPEQIAEIPDAVGQAHALCKEAVRQYVAQLADDIKARAGK